MQDTYPLLLECLASALLSLAVLRTLSRPLTGLLERLCPDEQAAAFWHGYTQVMLTLAPLLCVLILDLLTPSGHFSSQLRGGLIAGLGGLLFGLWIVGRRLGRFIETAQRPGEAP